jgi:hypothetical protein
VVVAACLIALAARVDTSQARTVGNGTARSCTSAATGLGPHAKRIVPPARTAATTARGAAASST